MYLGSREQRPQHIRLKILPPSLSRFFKQCGILNISQPYSTPSPVTEIALFVYTNEFRRIVQCWPPLWCPGQSSWLQKKSSRFRLTALSDFLIIGRSGTGTLSLVRISEQILERKVATPVRKTEIKGRADPQL
jgi:hypothetical protein